MITIILAIAAATTPSDKALDRVSAAFASAKAWQVSFEQVFIPSGFTSGTTEKGEIVLLPPDKLRFDYASKQPRTFAVDGAIARNVDVAAGACDAIRLDNGVWARLPLATLLDPATAQASFVITQQPNGLLLIPRQTMPELTKIDLILDDRGFIRTMTVWDENDNRNMFTFSSWKPTRVPAGSFFQPALPGQTPCKPEQG